MPAPTKSICTETANRSLSLQELAESEHRFRTMVEALPDAILIHVNGKIVFVNPFCVQLHGAQGPGQLLGHEISDFIGAKYLPEVRRRIQHCYSTGAASTPFEVALIDVNGSPVDIEALAIPISWMGAPAIEVVLRDIRKRKHAERAAHDWQKRLEMAQKAGLRIGLWDWDLITNTVIWSDETYRQFGLKPGTFSGRVEDASVRIHPDDQQRVGDMIRKVLDGKAQDYAAQYRVVRPDGTLCWIDAHGVMVSNGSKHMMGIGVDITDLKNNAISLQRSEEKYRNLFENARQGMFRSRPDGTLLDANPALVTMLGYESKEELLSLNLARDIYEDPAERQKILDSYGIHRWVDILELNWKRKDGRIITVRTTGGRIIGEDGLVSHYEVIVEDITERRRLEAQYRQAQKMEAVGLLAGGISHDFNNLLGVIIGNAELLLEATPSGPQQHYGEAIKQAGASAAQLVRQLLAFSRKQVLYSVTLDLNTIVGDISKILKRLIGEDVQVETLLQKGLGSVRADRGQMEQILMNLATNARDAMPNGGKVSIRTENAELTLEDAKHCVYVKPGKYIRLSVSDSGVGMSEEVKSRVFEPFFTTKPQGHGTGLGLATVYGIVKQSGGYIWITSSPGTGSTCDVYLPRLDEAAVASAPDLHHQAQSPKGTETILLLEDEVSLRAVTCEFLTASGYKVLQASRGDEAISLAEHYKGEIALIISDVVLPEMSGPLAVKKLQALHPEMKALYVSGYTEVPVAQQIIAEGLTVMSKPVPRIDLLNKVDEMLHA